MAGGAGPDVDIGGGVSMSSAFVDWSRAYTSPFTSADVLGEPRCPDPDFQDRTNYYRLETRFHALSGTDGTLYLLMQNNPLNCDGSPVWVSTWVHGASGVDWTSASIPRGSLARNAASNYAHAHETEDPNFFPRLTTLYNLAHRLRVIGGGMKAWVDPPPGSAAPAASGTLQGYHIDMEALYETAPIITSAHVTGPDQAPGFVSASGRKKVPAAVLPVQHAGGRASAKSDHVKPFATKGFAKRTPDQPPGLEPTMEVYSDDVPVGVGTHQSTWGLLSSAPLGFPQLLKQVSTDAYVHAWFERYVEPQQRPGPAHIHQAVDGITGRFQDLSQFQFVRNTGRTQYLDTSILLPGDESPYDKARGMNCTDYTRTYPRIAITKYTSYGDLTPATGTIDPGYTDRAAGFFGQTEAADALIHHDEDQTSVVHYATSNPVQVIAELMPPLDDTAWNGNALLVKLWGSTPGTLVTVQCVWHVEYVPTSADTVSVPRSPVDARFTAMRRMFDDESAFPLWVKGHSFWKSVREFVSRVASAAATVGKVAGFVAALA